MATEKEQQIDSATPAPDAGTGDDSGLVLDQSMLDALMAAAADEEDGVQSENPPTEALLTAHDDDALIQPNAPTGDELIVDKQVQSEIVESDSLGLDQSLLDALIASAEVEDVLGKDADEIILPQQKKEAPVAPTPPDKSADTEAVPEPEKSDAVPVIEEAASPVEEPPVAPPPKEVVPVTPAAPAPIAKHKKDRPDSSKPVESKIRLNLPKIISSISVGVFTWFLVSSLLTLHRDRTPDAEILVKESNNDFSMCMQDASLLLESKLYKEAVTKLEAALKIVPSDEDEVDALYLQVVAARNLLSVDMAEEEKNKIFDTINKFLAEAQNDPRMQEVRQVKAAVYECKGMVRAAFDTYRDSLPENGDVSQCDALLYKIAELGMELKQHDDAAGYLLWLLDQCPQSPLVRPAKLMLADAYRLTQRKNDATSLYNDLIQEGAECSFQAYAGLGQTAMDNREYAQAIELFKKANDKHNTKNQDLITYLMAKAYHQIGQHSNAHQLLKNYEERFFRSEHLPYALCELSQVLKDMGMQSEAQECATYAARKYPDNVDVLHNLATFYIAADKKQEAADVLQKAVRLGKPDADLLLQAAQYRLDSGAGAEARKILEELVTLFPHSSQGFEAQVQLAQILCSQGKTEEGIARLEQLADSAQGPQLLLILRALFTAYNEGGLFDRRAAVASHIAAITTEPAELAQAALALFDGDMTDQAVAVAQKVDLDKVDAATAYDLLSRTARTMLESDPKTAGEMLSKAIESYPDEVKPRDELNLMTVCLATDNVELARSLLEKMSTRSEAAGRAAVSLADYLYDKGEFEQALDAYDTAIKAGKEADQETLWSIYQKANLVARSDEKQALELYDQVAKSGASCSGEAKVKAGTIRAKAQLNERKKLGPRANANAN